MPTGIAYHVPEYYNYADVEKFEEEKLGIHEKLEGYHDDYYITSIIATVTTDGIRMPERVKAGKFVINGVPSRPIEKTIANGKRIVRVPHRRRRGGVEEGDGRRGAAVK